jgi:hypothetical protein
MHFSPCVCVCVGGCVFWCLCNADNIAERLVGMKLPITRLGHPARVLDSLSSSTLEHQLTHSDESEIIRDLQMEINQSLAKLSAQGKDRLRGKARGEVYRDVQELRKDYRQRERGHIRSIISSARIICATAHGYIPMLLSMWCSFWASSHFWGILLFCSAGSRQLENQKFDAVIIDVRARSPFHPQCRSDSYSKFLSRLFLQESTQAFEAVRLQFIIIILWLNSRIDTLLTLTSFQSNRIRHVGYLSWKPRVNWFSPEIRYSCRRLSNPLSLIQWVLPSPLHTWLVDLRRATGQEILITRNHFLPDEENAK